MNVKNVCDYLESFAPKAYQESYDNAGLLTGDPSQEITGVLVTLDCTEEVVQEAISLGANMVVAHHPIIFKGLKKITGENYVERTVIKAIRHHISLYAIHTNLDNIHKGVNKKIAEKIGLKNLRILLPKKDTLTKLVTFIPQENVETVMTALHEAGAGQIGDYKNCSFRSEGTGTFMPSGKANPFKGKLNELEVTQEVRIEVVFPRYLDIKIMEALRTAHPYEEVAYYLTSLENNNQEVGSGMIGELETPMEPSEFLSHLKDCMGLNTIRHTQLLNKKVQKIAVCGGSGSFLLSHAIRSEADFFVSADFKYHEFFDAESRITIADIGHYESEQYTKELLREILMEKFPTFAVNFSSIDTNPVRYL